MWHRQRWTWPDTGGSVTDRLRTLTRTLLAEILEWDVVTWSRGVKCWFAAGLPGPDKTILDLGARRGGLALLFALDGSRVVCSDLDGPAPEAEELHQRHGLECQIEYRALDATQLDLPTASVDAVCFKSIIGGIGRGDNFAAQHRAMAEIRRVLVPGGRLYFAENLSASPLHGWLRQQFIPWGRAWRYVALEEMKALLADFTVDEWGTTGFLATFGRSNAQRDRLAAVDRIISPLIPPRWRYVVYGIATKPDHG